MDKNKDTKTTYDNAIDTWLKYTKNNKADDYLIVSKYPNSQYKKNLQKFC